MKAIAAHFLALCFSVAQAQPAFAQAEVSDEVLERIAVNESRLRVRLGPVIYDDPAMRAEIRRIGFEKGCHAVADSRREVVARYALELVPATVEAIRKRVPANQLSEMRARSFLATPLVAYASRIDAEIERIAPDILTAADEAMRQSFLRQAQSYPDVTDPAANKIIPRADIAATGIIQGYYDLDKPSHLALACADFLISPDARPKITTSSPPKNYIIISPDQLTDEAGQTGTQKEAKP